MMRTLLQKRKMKGSSTTQSHDLPLESHPRTILCCRSSPRQFQDLCRSRDSQEDSNFRLPLLHWRPRQEPRLAAPRGMLEGLSLGNPLWKMAEREGRRAARTVADAATSVAAFRLRRTCCCCSCLRLSSYTTRAEKAT